MAFQGVDLGFPNKGAGLKSRPRDDLLTGSSNL